MNSLNKGADDPRGWDRIIWPATALAIAACIAIASIQAHAQSAATTIAGRATVEDGDSIRIGEHRVILWGIDAPEGDTACGRARPARQSQAALRRMLGRRDVQCEVRSVDRNGREVSLCRVEGRDVGAIMVEQGWARDWPRHSCSAYANAEAGARQARRGIWAMECPASLWGERNYAADRCRQPDAPAQ